MVPAGLTPRRRSRLPALVWVLLALSAVAAAVLAWTPARVPSWVPTGGAVGVTTLYAAGLAARTGGRPVLVGAGSLTASVTAVLSGVPMLLAGAMVTTAAVSALLGVMATRPAARFAGVVRECVVATAVCAGGAFAAAAYAVPVRVDRTGYLVLGLSLLGCLALVHRLGAGLHGLGRRGLVTMVGGLVLLVLALAYTAALARWGSPGLVAAVRGLGSATEGVVGAVPRPIEVLVGFPALAWGVSTRARRRQGWWVCAFGTAGLARVAVSLLAPGASLAQAGLGLLYSGLMGLVLGYLVIRTDAFLTGSRGRRARRAEEAAAHRPEPGRLQPLM